LLPAHHQNLTQFMHTRAIAKIIARTTSQTIQTLRCFIFSPAQTANAIHATKKKSNGTAG
jgi:hypothetical protein